jgi:ABC-2 type transport system ATP-binding protein
MTEPVTRASEPAIRTSEPATGSSEPARTVEPAIRVEGLVKRYGARPVLKGVTFTVSPREIVALLGPNGAGKTTTVEIVEGYRRGDGGTVTVLGADSATGGPALRARVGLMLQGGGLDPRSTPRDVLRLYASFHLGGRDPEALLGQVGLAAVARTRVRRLSGGERQRLALALALVGDPDVLILDEPTAGMDAEAKRDTRLLLASLRDEGRAILLTTHDLADVERLADRVAILHHGRIVAEGSVAELTGVGEARLRVRLGALLSEASGLALRDEIRRTHPIATIDIEPRPASWFVVGGVSPDPWLIAAVASWLASKDLPIIELHTAGGSLEDRYLELTGDHDVEAAS